MARTRSDYRLAVRIAPRSPAGVAIRPVSDDDRDALAPLLLDAYRGTIDDEGEDLDDAFEAIDRMLERAIRPFSFVATIDTGIAGFSFVIELDGVHYIDPVVVGPAHKRTGVGTAAVDRSLDALAAAQVVDIGATITDGNIASETLFRRLGFERHGPWG